MRSLVQRNRLVLACRVAALALVAGAGAGCSSGFTRFDQSLYTSDAVPTANTQYGAAQPYPGDVDPTSTASINRFGRGPVPAENVAANGVADHTGYNPAGGYPQSQTYTPPPVQSYQQSEPATQIQRGNLDSPIANALAYKKAPLLAPQTEARRPAIVDPVSTSAIGKDVEKFPQTQATAVRNKVVETRTSTQATAQAKIAETKTVVADETQKVAQLAPQKPAMPDRGWTATGGTSIQMREGETLYNLSKRYGVPVSAILAANNLKDASSVKAGQQIIVPNYVYSRSAPVSAPDNDPSTLKASSARGEMAGQQPYPVAAVDSKADEDGERNDPRYKAKRKVQDAPDQQLPDYSVTTGSVNKPASVTVVSGDSLAKIAKKHSVSVADLKSANGLTNDNLRIGQVLKLPGAQKMAQAGPVGGVDPIVTGTANLQGADGPKPYVKPNSEPMQKLASTDKAAPARTGIEEFRWPVRGRVISNFGEKTSNGRNDGIDISVPEGTAVKAAENGVVVYAGDELEGLGNLLLVRHADGWVSAYAHNKSLDVKRGEEVKRGQTIARSGRTGSAEMPKLHFELRKSSTPVDPLKHLGGA